MCYAERRIDRQSVISKRKAAKALWDDSTAPGSRDAQKREWEDIHED